jgi:hypothetical protein
VGAFVGNYRLYPQDKRGQFLGAVEFIAPDDTVALQIAERTSAGQPCELWDGTRLVSKIKEAVQ